MLHLQENAAKPEGLPPNQGGKYVGFGSGGSAPPPRRGHGGGGGLDDVSLALSKGFSHLSTAAGTLLVPMGQPSSTLRNLAQQSFRVTQDLLPLSERYRSLLAALLPEARCVKLHRTGPHV